MVAAVIGLKKASFRFWLCLECQARFGCGGQAEKLLNPGLLPLPEKSGSNRMELFMSSDRISVSFAVRIPIIFLFSLSCPFIGAGASVAPEDSWQQGQGHRWKMALIPPRGRTGFGLVPP